MKNIFIFGATSAIAEEVAKKYALTGCHLTLFARNQDKLNKIQQDLLVRGAASVNTIPFDAEADDYLNAVQKALTEHRDNLDICLVAHGSLPDQAACQQAPEHTLRELQINGTSVIGILTLIANRMEQQGTGNIAVITSVAGVRGRQSNYVYGAAKGMVSVFLQGLAQRLAKANVHVLDIKPGFVDTPMTADFKKGLLWAQPDKVADIICERIAKRSHQSYTPFFWFFIMTVISSIPTKLFNKIKL